MNYYNFKMGQEQLVSEFVGEVFAKFEAPEYPEEGIQTFKAFITPENLKDMMLNSGFRIYCCFDNDKLIGVLAFKNESHISLLFVHEEYHRQGIAKRLLSFGLDELKASGKNVKKITVNSSPYARDIYKRMGFSATSEVQQQDGLLFIPMVKEICHGDGVVDNF